jgi:hypothetical protein
MLMLGVIALIARMLRIQRPLINADIKTEPASLHEPLREVVATA